MYLTPIEEEETESDEEYTMSVTAYVIEYKRLNLSQEKALREKLRELLENRTIIDSDIEVDHSTCFLDGVETTVQLNPQNMTYGVNYRE